MNGERNIERWRDQLKETERDIRYRDKLKEIERQTQIKRDRQIEREIHKLKGKYKQKDGETNWKRDRNKKREKETDTQKVIERETHVEQTAN